MHQKLRSCQILTSIDDSDRKWTTQTSGKQQLIGEKSEEGHRTFMSSEVKVGDQHECDDQIDKVMI